MSQVITETMDWKGGIVAINGVGLGSEYSHIIVKSHGMSGPKEITPPADGLPRLMLVSGRSEEGLQKLVAKVQILRLLIHFVIVHNFIYIQISLYTFMISSRKVGCKLLCIY